MEIGTKMVCEKCKGTGRIKEKDGTIHICFDCLRNGSMDQHGEKMRDAKDFGIKF